MEWTTFAANVVHLVSTPQMSYKLQGSLEESNTVLMNIYWVPSSCPLVWCAPVSISLENSSCKRSAFSLFSLEL